MMTDRELMQMALPCPFCGGIDISTHEGSNFRWMVAECMTCGARSSEIRKQTVGEGNPQQWHEKAQRRAMEEWNTRTRLAQPEPEELGEIVPADEEQLKRIAKLIEPEPVAYDVDGATVYIKPPIHNGKYLTGYTAPPQREWQGLTDEEIDELAEANLDFNWKDGVEDFARAIEAKLKEKNHG